MTARRAVVVALVVAAPARAEPPGYDVRVAAETTIALGTSGAVSVTVVPSGSRTVSAAGPIRLAVAAPASLAVARPRYGRRDAADPAADAPRFDIKLKPRAAGDHRVALDLRFWLCGKRVCWPIATRREVVVHVPAAPPR